MIQYLLMRGKCPYSDIFWSVIFRIWFECGKFNAKHVIRDVSIELLKIFHKIKEVLLNRIEHEHIYYDVNRQKTIGFRGYRNLTLD